MHRAPAETLPPLGGRIATGAMRTGNDTFEKFTLSFRASAHTGVGVRFFCRDGRPCPPGVRVPIASLLESFFENN